MSAFRRGAGIAILLSKVGLCLAEDITRPRWLNSLALSSMTEKVSPRIFAIVLTEFLQVLGTCLCIVSKLSMTSIEHMIAERELSRARNRLRDLVEIYRSGHWQRHYKNDKFAKEVRRAKQAVDYWVEACSRHVPLSSAKDS